MKKTYRQIEYFLIILFILISINSCSKTNENEYQLEKGECYKLLSLKNLGGGRYNIILHGEGVEKCEILGEMEGNKISATAGSAPIHFIIQDNKILLLHQEKRCTFKRIE